MFELHTTQTGRGFSKGEHYSTFDTRREVFNTMREVYAYLRSVYGKSRRQPMYIDRKDGTTIKCGWVIGFRNADYSHAPIQHWLQQDWIELRESNTVSL